ncbi:GSCOCG00011799001-RA-CDS, partial [Cotesia congregata]
RLVNDSVLVLRLCLVPTTDSWKQMDMNDVLDKADIEQRLVETTGQSFDRLFKTLLLHQTSSTEIFQTVNNNGSN